MVVLFVFATIQEGELSESVHEAAALAQENLRLETRVSELQKRVSAEQEDMAAQLEQREAQTRRAREAMAQLQEHIEELEQSDTRTDAHRTAAETIRRGEVLAKLLDHFSVFEIEIAGALGDSQVNRCCYRTDLEPQVWQRCGEIPSREADIEAWLETGASGLVDALRKTKGGNALVVVRQDEQATYRISAKLEGTLRARFPDHAVYDDALAPHALACADIP